MAVITIPTKFVQLIPAGVLVSGPFAGFLPAARSVFPFRFGGQAVAVQTGFLIDGTVVWQSIPPIRLSIKNPENFITEIAGLIPATFVQRIAERRRVVITDLFDRAVRADKPGRMIA